MARFIVEGDNAPNLIDPAYAADADGDRIDNADAFDGSDDDVVDASGGDDTILSGAGDDRVFAGSGNDSVEGGSGDDLIYGDSNVGARLTFEDELAGFQNTVGVYEIDPATGAISDVRIAFDNASLPGSGGDLASGSTFEFDVADGSDIGVFILADGFNENDIASFQEQVLNGNGTLAFVDASGGAATLSTTNPQLVFTDNDGVQTPLVGATYHTAGFGANLDLNPDGALKTELLGGNGTDSITFGFEDLPQPGNPETFDDSILTLDIVNADASFSLEDATPPGGVSTIAGTAIDTGPDGDDTLLGGSGADTIFGEGGDDVIDGGAGDDFLDGGTGNDSIDGGAGDDTITGGEGADTLSGGDGRDTFFGITPGDVIVGGDGGDDFDTIDMTGAGPFIINIDGPDSDGNGFDGSIDFLDDTGAVIGTATFENIESLPCFTPGTVIATPKGERLVEDLREGDRVITRDNGLQEIRWVGRRDLNADELHRAPHLQPVLIRAGALGHGLPERDMMVSPQHRMLIQHERNALYFDEREVLAAARHLTGMDGVDTVATRATSYIHFMCDRHEVVLSNGAWTESFQPGEQVLDGMGAAQRDEIFELFPDLRNVAGLGAYRAARRSLKRHEAQLLAV